MEEKEWDKKRLPQKAEINFYFLKNNAGGQAVMDSSE